MSSDVPKPHFGKTDTRFIYYNYLRTVLQKASPTVRHCLLASWIRQKASDGVRRGGLGKSCAEQGSRVNA